MYSAKRFPMSNLWLSIVIYLLCKHCWQLSDYLIVGKYYIGTTKLSNDILDHQISILLFNFVSIAVWSKEIKCNNYYYNKNIKRREDLHRKFSWGHMFYLRNLV